MLYTPLKTMDYFFYAFHLGMTVARVRLNRLDTEAYSKCFQTVFSTVRQDHPQFRVGKMLVGIITDWSDQQFNGLAEAIGEEPAEKLVKGCRVSQWCVRLIACTMYCSMYLHVTCTFYIYCTFKSLSL